MSPWISERPAGEVAAELARSRGALAGVRLALDVGLDSGLDGGLVGGPVAALCGAGAVVVGTTIRGGCPNAIGCGAADLAVGADCNDSDTGYGGVAITPTVGTMGSVGVVADSEDRLTLFAHELALANRAMGIVAAAAPGPWPADTRLAASPEPLLAVPGDWPAVDGHRAAFDAALAALADAGARFVEVDMTEVADEVAAAVQGSDALVAPAVSALAVPFGLCAVRVGEVRVVARAYDDAVALDVAACSSGVYPSVDVWPVAAADVAELVVFGAHLHGGPLAHQLTDLGARWAGELTTAPHYRMTVLPTVPAKPAVTRVPHGTSGAGLTGHRWLLSPAALGRFLMALPAPMQLGKVEFDDGTWRTAFGCDAAAATGADISGYGSWPAAMAAGAI